ncbi:MAG: DUF4870 domain-containing protein [Acidimicrobiales bacterium]|jgi:hypothetical protein|nr:DUF4870 domain-containing protein [Acidimicrobiales bacterium]
MSDAQQTGTGGNPAPGWYPDPNGQMRWWDGTQWGDAQAAAPMAPGYAATSGGNPRSMAMLAHILVLLTGFVGPLILYLMNNNKPAWDPFERHHTVEALNFGLTLLIAYLVSFVLMFVLIGFLLVFVVMIAGFVLPIMGAVKANNGEWWKYPVNIRMIQGAAG